MKGTTHMIVAGGLFYLIYPDPVFAGVAALGGLLPDLDHPKSTLGRRVPFMSPIGVAHRHWFHSMLGLLAFTLPTIYLTLSTGLAIGVGYFSHLILDTLNPTGIMWLYPFSKKKYHLMRIRTGGIGESLLSSILLLLLINHIMRIRG